MEEHDPAVEKRFRKALAKGGVEQRGPLDPPSAADWAALASPGTAAGKPKRDKAPKLATSFQRRQRSLSTVDRGVGRFRRSAWVGELSKGKCPLSETLDEIQARVAKSPNEATLREAQIVLNDLAKLSGAGEQIASRLTQELVDTLTERGR